METAKRNLRKLQLKEKPNRYLRWFILQQAIGVQGDFRDLQSFTLVIT